VVADLEGTAEDVRLDGLDHELTGERAGDRPPVARYGSTGEAFGHTV
jgi:hypothetical protein